MKSSFYQHNKQVTSLNILLIQVSVDQNSDRTLSSRKAQGPWFRYRWKASLNNSSNAAHSTAQNFARKIFHFPINQTFPPTQVCLTLHLFVTNVAFCFILIDPAEVQPHFYTHTDATFHSRLGSRSRLCNVKAGRQRR